jgi:hypothetical protein
MTAIFGLAIVGFAAVFVLGYLHNKKRHDQASQYAIERGWSYERRDSRIGDGWRFGPFGQGSGRAGSFIMTGLWSAVDANGAPVSRHFRSYEYEYTESSGVGENSSSTTYEFHVVEMQIPRPLPWLELAPEDFGTRMFAKVGVKDIQFEYEAFNRKWHVTAQDRRFAFDVVHQRMMELLMGAGYDRSSIRIHGHTVFAWRRGHVKFEQIEPTCEALNQFINSIPQYVWDGR